MQGISTYTRVRRAQIPISTAGALRLWAAVGLVATNCADGDAIPGVRGDCSISIGIGPDCPRPIVDSSAAVCSRLVECGAIPVAHDDDGVFDYGECLDFVDGLGDFRREFVFACVEAALCDDLKVGGSPDQPRELPICLEHGDT